MINELNSILTCLRKRAAILGYCNQWDWVSRDPLVFCFTPALFLLAREGYLKLSDAVMQTSHEAYLRNAALWMKREHQLRMVQAAFAKANIDLIPLKGAALVETLYEYGGIRMMGDIDILVRPEQYIQAAETLLGCGLQPKWQHSPEDLFDFRSLPERYWPGELSFADGQGFNLDLHRDLVTYHWFKTAFPVDMRTVWARATPTSTQGSLQPSVLAWQLNLSPYDTLAYLCLHLGLHGLQIVKNFLDVDLFLRSLPPDWDWLVYLDLVEKWQIRSICFHAFAFCQDFFDASIPEDVMQALIPSNFDRWQVQQLISPKTMLENRQSLGKRYPTLAKFALIDNTHLKFQTLWDVIFPEKSLFSRGSSRHSIFEHWHHIYIVIRRGD